MLKLFGKFFCVCLAALALAPFAADAKDTYTKNISKLPAAAVAFINENFSETQLSGIKIDKGMLSNSYDVYMEDGTKIEFNSKGEWKEVENKVVGISGSVIPEKMKDYIAENFKGAKIISIESKKRGFEVELSNDLDLIFDRQGNFIGID